MTKRSCEIAVLGAVLLAVAASPGAAKIKPNEVRTGWGFMYGAARRVSPIGKQASLWVSYDAFSANISVFSRDILNGQWALASVRSDPKKKRGIFAEGGAGWGRRTEKVGEPSAKMTKNGLGWQAGLGYRFSPSVYLGVKTYGIGSDSFAPWLTLGVNF